MMRNIIKYKIYLFLPVLLIGMYSLDSREGSIASGGTIVVEAARVEESAEKTRTGAATILTLPENASAGLTLPDVLERESSVNVRRYGGKGYLSTISIRGSNPNQVPVYLDGIPLSNGVNGEVNLEDYDLNSLSSVEIYRSGGYVGSPIGGSLNLVTRKTGTGEGGHIYANGGSYRSFGMGAGAYGGGELWRYHVTGKAEVSDQNYTFHNDNGTPLINRVDDYDDVRKNAWYRNAFSTLNLSTTLGRTSLFLLNDSAYRKHGVPGPVPEQTEKTERHVGRNTTGVGTDTKGLGFEWIRLETRAYYMETKQEFFDPLQEFRAVRSDSRSDLYQSGFHIEPTLYRLNEFQTIRFYFAFDGENYRKQDLNQYHNVVEELPGKTREHYTARLEDEFAFLDDRVILLPVIEFQRYLDRYERQYKPGDANVVRSRFRRLDDEAKAWSEREFLNPEENDDSFYPIEPEGKKTEFWNGRLAGRYVFWKRNVEPTRPKSADESGNNSGQESRPNRTGEGEEFYIKGSYGRGNRVPLFVELFGESGSIVGNPDLKPERSENYDAGLGTSFHRNGVGGELEIIAFRKDIRDMILFIPNSQFTLRPENISGAKIRGVEINGKLSLLDHVGLRGNYTYQRALDDSHVESLQGNYLPLRPMHELHSGISLFNENWEGEFETIYVGAVFRHRTNDLPGWTPPRWIYNFRLQYIPYSGEDHEELRVGLDIKNIQNTRYTDITGYPLPGRSVYAFLNYRF